MGRLLQIEIWPISKHFESIFIRIADIFVNIVQSVLSSDWNGTQKKNIDPGIQIPISKCKILLNRPDKSI